MASKRFEKGSKEWELFTDFWALCQKYWVPEEDEGYWRSLINDAGELSKKFKDRPFPSDLIKALLTETERKYKAMTKKKE